MMEKGAEVTVGALGIQDPSFQNLGLLSLCCLPVLLSTGGPIMQPVLRATWTPMSSDLLAKSTAACP